MANNNDAIAFSDTFTNFGMDGSFDTVTIAFNGNGVSGVVVCFDAATASYRISNPIIASDNALTDFVDAVCSFVGTNDIEHDVWFSLERLEAEYDEAYGC